jgi:hypothetical protein
MFVARGACIFQLQTYTVCVCDEIMLVERLAVGGGPSHLKNLMWLNETFRFFNFTRRHDDVDLCPIQPKNYVAR